MKRSLRLTGWLLAGCLLLPAVAPGASALPGNTPAPAPTAPTAQSSIDQLWARGEAAFERGDLAAALEAFNAALSLDEGRARSWNYLGGVHFEQGDLVRALEEFRRAAQLDPGDVRAANNLGTALERIGSFEDAERQYLLVTRLDPAYPTGWRNLGVLYARRLSRPEAARGALLRYLELAPAGTDADEIRREHEAMAAER